MSLLSFFLFISCRPVNEKAFEAQCAIMQKNDALLKKQGLKQCASIEVSYKSIKCFTKRYSTQKKRFKTVDEAREYIVDLIEQYLQPLDKNTIPSKYFHITVSFRDEQGNYLTPPWIAAVGKYKDTVYYFSDEMMDTIHSESYEKACALVKTSKK